jgi:hypothetical protein
MIPKSWLFAAAAISLAAVLAVLGGVAWRGERPRCAMDGAILSSTAFVVVETEGGLALDFCSLGCAEHYLNASQLKPWRILLADESSGRPIDAADAYFARSQVVVKGSNGDRRHVFKNPEDAAAHAETFRGRQLTAAEAPFAAYRGERKATRRPRGPLKHSVEEKSVEFTDALRERKQPAP